ncbi:MAG TPA: UTP--glucose-1-phosphate uridylyltransferase GalU [Gammaproteobacteria bacterium]|nr:UTP--glucose-1-phosphate uridylyltransferase GalU [Gammaproteobacteria bacterium]
MPTIRKAVFPVAGLGTRFLPATKASPKEMLPVVDKPLVQYAAEEAVRAGAKVLIFVTGRNKYPIANHFDRAYELETELQEKGKTELLKIVQDVVPPNVACVHVRQTDALGLGHAVLCAEPVVGNEPFYVILADDLIDAEDEGCLAQMGGIFAERESSLVAVQQIASADSRKYGVVKSHQIAERLHEMDAIVEKPEPEKAPSNLGVVGRYVLTPRIFELLKTTKEGSGGEIQLTDAIAALLEHEKVYAYEFSGIRHDCGDKLGYLQANVELGLKHPELGPGFREYLTKKAELLLNLDETSRRG